jgi:uncharacterized protein involved in response to NO
MITLKIWHAFKTAPHRVMFLGGALQTLAVMLWFMIELLTRYGVFWHPIEWAIAPSAAHAYLMLYGLFPMFMFGFLMTTFPRWLKGTEIPKQSYVPAFMMLMLGAVGFYVGLLTTSIILIIAVCSTLSGWGLALYALLRVLLDTPHQDKRHPLILFIALSLGWCFQIEYLVFLAMDNLAWLRFSIEGGIWLFLLPVFATVGHRMIPFFTSSALPQHRVQNPNWPWWVMLVASAGHCLLGIDRAYAWLWLCDVPLAIAALYLSRCWGFRRSLKVPMLAVLHVGFAWLGIAMVLFTVQSVVLFVSHGHTFIWGLAPLHALTIGCFATLLIGMATRVTLAHSGLPMKADTPIKLMFVGVQIVAVLRVLADMLPIQNTHWLYFAAGTLWLLCFTPWMLRYLPVYWRQRADGRTG